MTQLIQMVYKAEEKQALQSSCETLSSTLTEFQDINDFNQQMMKLNMEYISHSLDLLPGRARMRRPITARSNQRGFKRFSQFDTKA